MPPSPQAAGELVRRKRDLEAVPVRLVVDARGNASASPLIADALRAASGQGATGEWRLRPLFGSHSRRRLSDFYAVEVWFNAATLPRAAFALGYEIEALLRSSLEDVRVRPDLHSTIYARPITRNPPAEMLAACEVDVQNEDVRWATEAMRCPEAWATKPPDGGAARGSGILIGHPDTGYSGHAELDGSALDLERDFDFVDNDDDARDPMGRFELPAGHGTRTAATIVGRDAGALVGAAPAARLLPIRATRSVALVRGTNVALAVDHARLSGCHVVSMSLGGVFLGGALEAAINEAVASGIVVMAAAGNWDWGGGYVPLRFVVWPARYRNCIAVAASNADAAPWRYSSRGRKVLVSAPGEDVWVPRLPDSESGEPGTGVSKSSGTSYGVAHLAGVAALWLGHWGYQSLCDRYGKEGIHEAFVHVIREHAFNRPAEWREDRYGVGIADAKKVLDAPLPDAAELRASVQATDAFAESTPWERLEAAIADEQPEQLEERLIAVFGREGDGLRAYVDAYGDELLYLLAENPAFLSRLAVPTSDDFVAESADDPATAAQAVRALVASAGSPDLVRALGPEATLA